jgi:hypothetical protein
VDGEVKRYEEMKRYEEVERWGDREMKRGRWVLGKWGVKGKEGEGLEK